MSSAPAPAHEGATDNFRHTQPENHPLATVEAATREINLREFRGTTVFLKHDWIMSGSWHMWLACHWCTYDRCLAQHTVDADAATLGRDALVGDPPAQSASQNLRKIQRSRRWRGSTAACSPAGARFVLAFSGESCSIFRAGFPCDQRGSMTDLHTVCCTTCPKPR